MPQETFARAADDYDREAVFERCRRARRRRIAEANGRTSSQAAASKATPRRSLPLAARSGSLRGRGARSCVGRESGVAGAGRLAAAIGRKEERHEARRSRDSDQGLALASARSASPDTRVGHGGVLSGHPRAPHRAPSRAGDLAHVRVPSDVRAILPEQKRDLIDALSGEQHAAGGRVPEAVHRGHCAVRQGLAARFRIPGRARALRPPPCNHDLQ
jgi:hypothetical protein